MTKLVEVPSWMIVELLKSKQESSSPTRAAHSPATLSDTTPYGQAALDGILSNVRAATEGTRNDTLNKLAFRFGQLVSGGELPESAGDALKDAARGTGLPDHEVEKTFRSGFDEGVKHPTSASEQHKPYTMKIGHSEEPPMLDVPSPGFGATSVVDNFLPADEGLLEPVDVHSTADMEPNWPTPQPLNAQIPPEPYPIDALPTTIREAVEEVQSFVKAPVAMVASSALAALSLAGQALVDVQRAKKLDGPASLFMLTIADSGERKSTCDEFFSDPIRQYQKEQAEVMKPVSVKYQADLSAWQAKREGILSAIKEKTKKNTDTAQLQEDLAHHQKSEPQSPRVPRMILGDETPESLAWSLAHIWPSAGIISSEAGVILGAHGMGKDSIMRSLGLLNVLWDGGEHSVGRRTSDSYVVRGVRLTVAFQIQEAALRDFIEKSGLLARGMGFFARFLIAWPESTQGFRKFTEAPKSWPCLSKFHANITKILNQPSPIQEDGTLSPVMLSFDQDAKAAWINFHNEVESLLGKGGELADIRDVASKAADNAARLSALFHLFEHGIGAIGAECFDSASAIVAWHLFEARRFFGELALSPEMADASRLDSWLIDYCRKNKVSAVRRSHILTHGPNSLRKKAKLDAAIDFLAELAHVRQVKTDKQEMLCVNPMLLGG